ncbi:uncharacterized protein I303_105250 [Kwoniella dejecticola CBS 10117]|uniref:Uncharacterized protein n=1 Tax=Kwoniella dejecticola CBS 10117 TaxID=1296121 RepID=A0A1A6A311_9TREE|nr:uncharacterized protein I303_05302 [Kwoniella dejecticola CBS 10117]OBR84444.1 hypothetical protein I303_05302 [Kwoniella dejecticola CBS 10117]
MSVVLYDKKKTINRFIDVIGPEPKSHVSSYQVIKYNFNCPPDLLLRSSLFDPLALTGRISPIEDLDLTPGQSQTDIMIPPTNTNQPVTVSKDPRVDLKREKTMAPQPSQHHPAIQGPGPEIQGVSSSTKSAMPSNNNTSAHPKGKGDESKDFAGSSVNPKKQGNQGTLPPNKLDQSGTASSASASHYEGGSGAFIGAISAHQGNKAFEPASHHHKPKDGGDPNAIRPGFQQRAADPRIGGVKQKIPPSNGISVKSLRQPNHTEEFDKLAEDYDDFSNATMDGLDPRDFNDDHEEYDTFVTDQHDARYPFAGASGKLATDPSAFAHAGPNKTQSRSFHIPGFNGIRPRETQRKTPATGHHPSDQPQYTTTAFKSQSQLFEKTVPTQHYQNFIAQNGQGAQRSLYGPSRVSNVQAMHDGPIAPQTPQRNASNQQHASAFDFTPSTKHSQIEELSEPEPEARFQIPEELDNHYSLIDMSDKREELFEAVLQTTMNQAWQPTWEHVKAAHNAASRTLNDCNKQYNETEMALRQLVAIKDNELKRKIGLTERYGEAGDGLAQQCQFMQHATRNGIKRRRFGVDVE